MSFRLVSLLLLLLAALSSGALCGDTAPKNPQMLINQQACIANYEKRDMDAAETRCEICLEYDERDAECLNGLGIIWYARGDDERARKYYIRAIRENWPIHDFRKARALKAIFGPVLARFAAILTFLSPRS